MPIDSFSCKIHGKMNIFITYIYIHIHLFASFHFSQAVVLYFTFKDNDKYYGSCWCCCCYCCYCTWAIKDIKFHLLPPPLRNDIISINILLFSLLLKALYPRRNSTHYKINVCMTFKRTTNVKAWNRGETLIYIAYIAYVKWCVLKRCAIYP